MASRSARCPGAQSSTPRLSRSWERVVRGRTCSSERRSHAGVRGLELPSRELRGAADRPVHGHDALRHRGSIVHHLVHQRRNQDGYRSSTAPCTTLHFDPRLHRGWTAGGRRSWARFRSSAPCRTQRTSADWSSSPCSCRSSVRGPRGDARSGTRGSEHPGPDQDETGRPVDGGDDRGVGCAGALIDKGPDSERVAEGQVHPTGARHRARIERDDRARPHHRDRVREAQGSDRRRHPKGSAQTHRGVS